MVLLTPTLAQSGRWDSANAATWVSGNGTLFAVTHRPTGRWTLAVPAGAWITSAVLTVTRSSSPMVQVQAWDVDTAGIIAPPVPISRPVLVGPSSTGSTFEVKDLLQAIIDRPGWVSGNAVALFLVWSSGASDSISGWSLTLDYQTARPVQGRVPVQVGVAGVAGIAVPVAGRVPVQVAVAGRAGRAGFVRGRVDAPVTLGGSTVTRAPGKGRVPVTVTPVATPTGRFPIRGRVTVAVALSATIGVASVRRLDADPELWERTLAATAWPDIDGRVELIDETGALVPDQPTVLAARINMDADAGTTWTGALTVAEDSIPLTPEHPLHPDAFTRVRCWWRVRTPDGLGEWPVGVMYVIEQPTIDDDGDQITADIPLGDAVTLIRQARWDRTMSLGGVDAATAIGRIIQDRAPWCPVRVTPSGFPLPATWECGEPGGDPWDDVDKIAEAATLTVYTDRFGVVVVTPHAPVDAPSVGFMEGPDCVVIDVNVSGETSERINQVTVVSSSPDVDPPVIGVAQVTDPSHPLNVGRGYLLSERVESDAVTTQAQAQALAQKTLQDRLSRRSIVKITHRARPDLDPGGAVFVQRARAGVAGQHTVRAWSLDMGTGVQETTLSGGG